ncbi:uncharacterized protein LOC117153794 isoform X1 [Bombus vancouverensis nearcticus]|uniref:Uncharacterized protein LOC117205857 n=1 Tax=Bombus bifarius TaxID=103933 RepID=A0A6P8LQC4_9HYME|nr:uncharacterized protein LOC117153794 [Bombus vancouverensis nearcticus]XP_033300524.1 uncharacterized protein LOC117205857 [Bombus bifarius]XP_050472159.1 uncharacterized protein LOC126864654 [Bombus huntii]
MRRNMSERYVKEILEKLEEIEKLHGKLRRLVPRVKVYESEGTKTNQFIMEKTNDNTRYFLEQNPIDLCQRLEIAREMSKDLITKVKKLCEPNTKTRKYFKKFKHYSNNKWESFKDYLSTMNASDIIFVSRGSQTSEANLPRMISGRTSSTPIPRVSQIFGRRRSTLRDLPEQLLASFGYSRDSNSVNESIVLMHDHALGKDEPHKVQKMLIIPDQETETLRVVASARRVSVGGSDKRSS